MLTSSTPTIRRCTSGSDFGIFSAESAGNAEPQVTTAEPITFKGSECAAGLREVAADALVAAEWLARGVAHPKHIAPVRHLHVVREG